MDDVLRLFLYLEGATQRVFYVRSRFRVYRVRVLGFGFWVRWSCMVLDLASANIGPKTEDPVALSTVCLRTPKE